MSAPADPRTPSEETHGIASLGTQRRGVIALLIGAAVLCAAAGFPDEEPVPDRQTTVIALGFALATVLLRRLASSPVLRERARSRLLRLTWAAAIGLAATGVWVAWSQGATRTGLAYAAVALLFSAARPAKVRPHHVASGRSNQSPSG
jgi:hypothetical protein